MKKLVPAVILALALVMATITPAAATVVSGRTYTHTVSSGAYTCSVTYRIENVRNLDGSNTAQMLASYWTTGCDTVKGDLTVLGENLAEGKVRGPKVSYYYKSRLWNFALSGGLAEQAAKGQNGCREVFIPFSSAPPTLTSKAYC